MATISYDEAVSVLGLSSAPQEPHRTADAIRRAFHREALKWHPDKQQVQQQQPSGPGPEDATFTRNEEAEERFKRLVAAYHLLLRAVRQGHDGVACSADDSQEGEELSTGAPAIVDEEDMMEAVSADLLLREASRMRLSDFDMMFLHQRASGGSGDDGSGPCSVWPEVSQSVEDVWRRIRRRVERRRRRRQGSTEATDKVGSVCAFKGPAASKWALLFEFVTDVLGADGEVASPQSQSQEADRKQGCEGVAAGAPSCMSTRHQGQASCVTLEWRSGEGGDGSAVRGHGRLPRGFYWRWCKRLLAARLLFYVFFKR